MGKHLISLKNNVDFIGISCKKKKKCWMPMICAIMNNEQSEVFSLRIFILFWETAVFVTVFLQVDMRMSRPRCIHPGWEVHGDAWRYLALFRRHLELRTLLTIA